MTAATFPSIEPNGFSSTNIIETQINVALSGRETRTQIGYPHYEFEYVFNNLDSSERRQILGHLANANGTLLPFYVKLPTGVDDAAGAAAGTIQVSAGAAVGVTTASFTKDSTANEIVFKSGDLIQFSNAGKIYQVKSETTSTAQASTVDFFPALKTAITTSHTINYVNVNALVRYMDDPSYDLKNNSYSDIIIRFKEVDE